MRVSIEYLTDSTNEASICQALQTDATSLNAAGEWALAMARGVQEHCGALAFLIRDLDRNGVVVAVETFGRLM